MKILDFIIAFLFVFIVGIFYQKKLWPFKIQSQKLQSRTKEEPPDYEFKKAKSLSSYDKHFETYFTSFDPVDSVSIEKKLNSLHSAIESGLVKSELIYKCIYIELRNILSLSLESSVNYDIIKYMNELLKIWKSQAPNYVNVLLYENLIKQNQFQNVYALQLKRMLEK